MYDLVFGVGWLVVYFRSVGLVLRRWGVVGVESSA